MRADAIMDSFTTNGAKEMDSEREQLADYAHDTWAGWMQYLFAQCTERKDGRVTMPKAAADRWKRQMKTPYAFLPEDEKQTDRDEADKILKIIRDNQ